MLIFVYTELLTSFIDMATLPLPTIGNRRIFPFRLYVASMRSRGMSKSKLSNFFSRSKLERDKIVEEKLAFELLNSSRGLKTYQNMSEVLTKLGWLLRLMDLWQSNSWSHRSTLGYRYLETRAPNSISMARSVQYPSPEFLMRKHLAN